jgi:predicted amidohydrolase YtcJ
MDPNIFREMVTMFHNAGLHVSVHAIGDRGIDWTVETYALAQEQKPTYGLRHGIIHCNIPTDWAIDTMAWMQKGLDAGYPEAQSVFMWWIGDTYAGNFGPTRCPRLKPFKTWLDHGMIWGGGSDYYVDPFPARYGIWASIARQTLLGVYGWNPWGMAESVDVRTALRSYTMWSAHQMFLEDKVGSLEAGKYADIAIWDKDMYTIPTDEIKDLKCLMTLFNGKIVWQDPNGWYNHNGHHKCR